MKSIAKGADTIHVEKHAAVFQLNLFGNPVFNPYEPCNEGK